jgi:8-oxo-dGTP diphosphatase
MAKERFKVVPAVYAILIKDNQILLLRRYNTGYQDGNYSFPAGHLDGRETLEDAIVREVKEEIGVNIEKQNLTLEHLIHRNADDSERIDFFYIVEKWDGEPRILEKDKCDELKWVGKYDLPENIVPEVRQAILNIFKSKSIYSDLGFK